MGDRAYASSCWVIVARAVNERLEECLESQISKLNSDSTQRQGLRLNSPLHSTNLAKRICIFLVQIHIEKYYPMFTWSQEMMTSLALGVLLFCE